MSPNFTNNYSGFAMVTVLTVTRFQNCNRFQNPDHGLNRSTLTHKCWPNLAWKCLKTGLNANVLGTAQFIICIILLLIGHTNPKIILKFPKVPNEAESVVRNHWLRISPSVALLRGQVWSSLGIRCQQQQLVDWTCRSNRIFPATDLASF